MIITLMTLSYKLDGKEEVAQFKNANFEVANKECIEYRDMIHNTYGVDDFSQRVQSVEVPDEIIEEES